MINTVFLKSVHQAMLLLLFHLLLQLLVSHSWGAVGIEVRCIESERQALLQLKAGFVDDYGFLSSWGNEEEKRDCCQWERVRCSNRTGHVQMLQLQGNGLYRQQLIFRGNITTSVIELQHLRYLNLSSNDFEYSDIPEFIGSLRNLRYLDVSNSYLAGEIPNQIGSLSHLRYLDLSHNSLHGAIPSQLGNLSQLQFLNIRKNYLVGAIPYELGNLSSLQMLYLGENSALKIYKENSVEAQWLSDLTSLTVLDLSWVLNLNHSHNLLSNLQNVRALFLEGCGLSDDDLLFLDPSKFNFSSLSILDLSQNNLSTRSLKSLGNICTLSMLSLSHVNLSDDFSTILHNLSGCASSTLQTLNLQFNQITGTLSGVSKFPSLKLLYLSRNQLNGISKDGNLDKCTLYLVDLTYNRLSVELPLMTRYLFGCRSTLQELYLGGNQITGRIPDILNFTSLKVLSLVDNKLNGTFENIRFPPQLAILEVSSNSIQDGILESLGKTCSLSYLGLSNNNISKELPMIIHNLFGCARSLKYLDLSLNQIIGKIPDLSNFSSLQLLDLSFNELNGEIPTDIRFPSQVETLRIASNPKLTGVITDSHFANMSMLQVLDLSLSSLTLTFSPNWLPPFQLSELNLRSCTNLGPNFPMWLQTQKSLISLDISDSRISDMVPEWFWSLSPVLGSLNISYNNLTGTIPNSSIRFSRYPNIILASNQFEGSVPSFLRRATYLDLSRNKFSSFGMFACANSSSRRLGMVVDLSNNHLSGPLPDCWDNFKSLAYLDLSNNNLSGKIPSSIGSLVELVVLVLRNNTLSGDLPLSLKNCTNLKMLDVGENKLSGKIPFGIGNAFKQLRMLSLRINHFSGSMPLDLCHLRSLEFLDLSSNNLSGEILKCLNDIMSEKESSANKDFIFNYAFGLRIPYDAFVTWKGVNLNFENTAFRLKGIDLSSNQLIGGIPMDIINLVELVFLNLSKNNLTGEIPSEIGRLKSLEFLDLSRNHFYGEIPSSLAQIDRLSMLNLSHNQLSGKIPTSTQLQSFDASCYEENLALCGKPLKNDCPGEEATQKPPKVEENENSIFSRPFYISMALGFITGFWGIFGSILVNRSWRHAYFRFLNNLTDAIYIMVAINMVKCRRWLNG